MYKHRCQQCIVRADVVISDVNMYKWENDVCDNLYFVVRNINLMSECIPEILVPHFETCCQCNPLTPHLNTKNTCFVWGLLIKTWDLKHLYLSYSHSIYEHFSDAIAMLTVNKCTCLCVILISVQKNEPQQWHILTDHIVYKIHQQYNKYNKYHHETYQQSYNPTISANSVTCQVTAVVE